MNEEFYTFLMVRARVAGAPEVLGSTSIASSVRGAARGEVIIGAESTGGSGVGSGVGSHGATLEEGRGDSTSGPGEVCTVRPLA
jgi:hypothetical protein